jgi:hypothetical protein
MLWNIWNNFNGSIWQALVVLLPIAILVYLYFFFSLKKDHWYFFDPKHNDEPELKAEGGDYEPHSKRYQDLAKLAITLSAAAIAFLINVLVGDKPAATVFAQRIQQVAPIEFGFFGCCIACLVFFMVVQSVWYEEYSHSADHSTYKRWKYAASMSLGWTGLLSFVLGFLWLARNLFRS